MPTGLSMNSRLAARAQVCFRRFQPMPYGPISCRPACKERRELCCLSVMFDAAALRSRREASKIIHVSLIGN